MQVGSHSGSRAGRWRAPVLFAGVVAVLVGLAVVVPGVVRAGSREPNPPVAASASPQPTGPQWWTVSAVVLDSGGGPQLCVGAVAESYPPQCGGPRIIGWDWDAVTGDEAASGVRWGEYEVVGTYVGGSSQDEQGVFTLTLPAGPARPPTDVPPPDPFGTPCPEPDGGWIVDRSKTDDIALHRAAEEAERLPGLGELWVDTTGSSTGTILNISVVGDQAEAQARLRPLWGGGLCVSAAERTRAELNEITTQIMADTPNVLGGGPGRGHVEVSVVLDEGDRLQRAFDERYGAGVVRVSSALQPYRGDSATPGCCATRAEGKFEWMSPLAV